jgi:hypothetical protein
MREEGKKGVGDRGKVKTKPRRAKYGWVNERAASKDGCALWDWAAHPTRFSAVLNHVIHICLRPRRLESITEPHCERFQLRLIFVSRLSTALFCRNAPSECFVYYLLISSFVF